MSHSIWACSMMVTHNAHWAENWQLSISINKCCVLNVGKVSHHVDVCLAGISVVKNLSYYDHLERLNVPTLELRRLRADLLLSLIHI